MNKINCMKNKAILNDAEQQILLNQLENTFEDNIGVNYLEGGNLPRRAEILEIINLLLELVFPGYDEELFQISELRRNLRHNLESLEVALFDQICRVLKHRCGNECQSCNISEQAADAVKAVLNSIPSVRETLKDDVKAAFAGDPAAMSYDEIILSYPCIKTITIQRFAHLLYLKKIPLLPRMMTEYAHSITGIDIHPGATIGYFFFIDHGTGIVIGETTIIGENVKIYQGVTLGGLSTRAGQGLRGKKRHPTIEDNVTIYANASILGGETVIGRDSVIGANAFITHSIPASTTVSIKSQELQFKTRRCADCATPCENWNDKI